MKVKTSAVLAATILALGMLSASSALADGWLSPPDHPWLVRSTLIGVVTSSHSDVLHLHTGDSPEAAAEFTYFLNPHWSVQALAAYTSLTIRSPGTDLGSVSLLPPALTLQYHFNPRGRLRPYVGVGIDIAMFTNTSGTLKQLETHVDTTVGLAAEIGVDYQLVGQLYLNANVKYLRLNTDVHVNALGAKDNLTVNAYIPGVGLAYRF